VSDAGERPAGRAEARLDWLDGTKGIAILWIVCFHCFIAYAAGRLPWPLDPGYFAAYERIWAPASPAGRVLCVAAAVLAAAVDFGYHGVAVFLVLSGFGLSYSLARSGRPAVAWPGWYRSRLVRLLPMYWVAHLVYLVSPFQARFDAVDYRFALSILGDRVVPIYTMFYYFNPALWYFGLLLQLYLVYPALFVAFERLGVARFLVVAAVVTFGARWALLFAVPVDGRWVQGGFFACRLWEFAVGMAAGALWRRSPAAIDAAVLSWRGFLAGAGLYALGVYSYAALWSYLFTDALIGTGLTVILVNVARAMGRLRWLSTGVMAVGASSYGLYLVHQPYVHYVGARMRFLDVPVFVVAAGGIIVVLVLGAMALERGVNALTRRALG
jgi:peptidoglycan/LPS O-acetylase OafA/YrhL